MLSRTNRFHGHTAVRRVYRTGNSARSSFGSIHAVQGERTITTKVAVVVSRKVDKSAVRRNRIRRRVYEIIRLHLSDITRPTDIVVTVYQADACKLPAEQLNGLVAELFNRVKII